MVFSCLSFEGSGPYVLFKFINSFEMDCWLSLQLSSTTICQINGTSSTYSLKMSFSILFSPPFKDFFFFFSMPAFGLKCRLFVRYCMQGMVKIYPTTSSKKLPALGDLEQLNWQLAMWHKRKKGKELGVLFCEVLLLFYYSLLVYPLERECGDVKGGNK